MRRIEYHPEALDDAKGARRWYAERSAAAAQRFEAELHRALEFAALMPEAGSPGAAGSRKLRLHGFPHAIVYRATEQVVLVLAVAHERREPGYWRKR
jgi:plasmid stabilization system protein ParE